MICQLIGCSVGVELMMYSWIGGMAVVWSLAVSDQTLEEGACNLTPID